MKFWSIATVVLIIVACVGCEMTLFSKVDMTIAKKGEAIFHYGEKNIIQAIKSEDLEHIRNIFNGKRLCSDNLSCGFSDNVSIVINETERFCFACDGCPVVYWKNKNKYFKLSEAEHIELREILSGYGFSFPCV